MLVLTPKGSIKFFLSVLWFSVSSLRLWLTSTAAFTALWRCWKRQSSVLSPKLRILLFIFYFFVARSMTCAMQQCEPQGNSSCSWPPNWRHVTLKNAAERPAPSVVAYPPTLHFSFSFNVSYIPGSAAEWIDLLIDQPLRTWWAAAANNNSNCGGFSGRRRLRASTWLTHFDKRTDYTKRRERGEQEIEILCVKGSEVRLSHSLSVCTEK